MYGQGNYVPQFRPAPPTPLPTFQQGPLAPAPFHQGPPITPTLSQPPPSVNQQGPSAPPSHVIPPGPPPPPPPPAAARYQHGPPVPQPSVPQGGPQPPPSIQQGPPVRIPPPGLLNTGQSYLHPSPVVHVSSQLAPSYPPPPQNSQYPSFIMNQNMQNSTPLIPRPPGPPLSGTSHPEMIRVPLPPRVLPPLPPSQGHMSFNNSLQPPPPGSAHSFQHIRPQHAPPTSSFIPVTPAPFLSSGDAPVDNIHPPSIPPPPPPPPPSSPPPVPPSPPSSTSPLHPDISARCSETPSAIPLVDASNISGHSNSDIGYRLSDSDVVGSHSVDKTICTAQATDAVPACDSNQITEGGTNCRMESLVESRSPYFIPSPPPKPVAEKVRKIELLCHFIAKNGPDFEIMFREKESDNPEFSFLFGGEAGSESAIAHEYFLWMRKKCSLESKLPDGYQKIESSSKSSEIGSLMQVSESIAADASRSPADSDMDMEDDTVQPENDRKSGIEGLNSKPVSACNEFHATKEQLHNTQSSVEHSPAKDVLPVLASCSGPYGQAEREKNKKDSPTFLEDLGPLTASPSAAGSGHTKALDPFTSGGSPFRLIQDYASDDSAEDNDGPCLEHTSPVNVSPLVTKSTQEEKGINLDVNLATSSHSGPERGFKRRSESILASPCMPDVSQEAQRASETTVLDSDKFCKTGELAHYNRGNQTFNDQSASLEASRGGDVLHVDVDVGHSNRKVQDEDATQAPVFKVDEFGRLLREDASDSDSDELYHIGRRGKRGRSWSRSRSPHDRRKRRSRSPWRRKGKRSRSRSRSPRKNKSRSRSPAFRRMGDHFGEKMRRDRGQIPDCFDFLRGRCYRGSSCRYLHHNPMNDEPRRYRSRQYLEDRQDSRNSALHEENKNIRATIPTDEQVDVIKEEIQPSQDLSVRGIDASGGDVMDEQREVGYVRNDAQPNISSEVAQSLVTVTSEIDHPEISGEAVQACQTHKIQALQEEPTAHLPEREIFEKSMVTNLQSSEPITDVQNHDSQGETSPCTPSPGKSLVVQQSEAVSSITLPLPGVQNADQVPPQVNSSLISDPSPDVALETMNQPSTGESYPKKSSQTQLSPDTSSLSLSPQSQGFASQSQAAQEQSLSFPVGDALQHTSPPFPQSVNASHVLQPPKEFSVAPMTTNIQFQSAGVERLPPYHAISHNHHAGPPPPSYSISSSVHAPGFNYSHSQPNPIPPRNDLPLMPSVRPYPSQELMDTRFAEIQPRTYLPAEVTHRAPLHMEDFRPRSLPMGNQLGQQFGASSFLRDDQFTHPVMTSGNQFLHVPQQDYHMQSQSMMREEHHLALPVQNDVQNVRSIPNQRLTFPFPVQGSAPSSSYTLDNMHSQSITFPRESHARQIQSLRTDSVPAREDYITSGNLSSSHHHQQQLPYGMLRSGADGFSVHLGASEKVDSSISGHLANLSNNLPHLPDTGISRFSGSAHYNPFASTFDKPPGSSKFSSNAFRQEFDKSYSGKYDSPFGLIHTPLDLGVAGPGSKHMASLPGSSRFVDQIVPRSGGLPLNAPSEEMNSSRNPREASVEGFPSSKYQSVRKATDGDQYDPLFDSIEPSSNVFGTFSHVQEQGSTSIVNKSVPQRAANEDVSRLSGSHRLLDVEENNKQKISMVAAVTRSSENDEFGETAVDAEAGAVENESPEPVVGKNWSPSNPIDIANTGAGEIEIDQVPASGKSKKSKDSRSMRLFKIAIADFVKEVLKPSWRQGNMSKEAFKTIVKKTVDKVSGAMKGHQVPKSQAKIDQYVESSQRKLTKLVMGYVDKYVKV